MNVMVGFVFGCVGLVWVIVPVIDIVIVIKIVGCSCFVFVIIRDAQWIFWPITTKKDQTQQMWAMVVITVLCLCVVFCYVMLLLLLWSVTVIIPWLS